MTFTTRAALRRTTVVLGACAVTAALALGTAPAAGAATAGGTATPGASTGTTTTVPVDVPVMGRASVTGYIDGAEGTDGQIMVHGLRRIDGGTVLYYSVGFTDDHYFTGTTWPEKFTASSQTGEPDDASVWGRAVLVDQAGGEAYRVLTASDGATTLATPETDATTTAMGVAGRWWVLYAVFPEVPDDVTTMDVTFGISTVVPGVTVADGAMTPTVDATAPVALGSGWPAVDPAAVAAARYATGQVYPLRQRTGNADDTTATTQEGTTTTVDIDADVLFEVDASRLGPDADDLLADVAAQLNTSAVAGTVTVDGYTDGTGATDHNLTLSQARADAVAAALQKKVTVDGLTWAVEGHGEADPVATDDTATGRQKNRRVTITFTTEEG